MRTARQGPHAGRPFWGCRRWPACPEILDAGSPHGAVDGVNGVVPDVAQPGASSPGTFPTPVVARPNDPRGQCGFYQAAALPAWIVQDLASSDLNSALVRSFAQWRLDYPLPRDGGLDRALRPTIATVEALLTRGTTPYASPAIEAALGPSHGEASSLEIDQAVRHVATSPTIRFAPAQFDSFEEQGFSAWVLDLVLRERLAWSLVPQIALASISPELDPNAAERGDFLLVRPEGEGILVEIDGSQHAEHASRDEGRDRALDIAGVKTIRIPAADARAAAGPAIDALRTLLLESKPNRRPMNLP